MRETAKQILQTFSNQVALMPGLSKEEIDRFEGRLYSLPDEVRELLSYSEGFRLPSMGSLRFTGVAGFELVAAFPASVALLADGCGNVWVVDINVGDGSWGAIFFVCHDPPVLVLQAPNLEDFLLRIFQNNGSSAEKTVKRVLEEHLNQIWRRDPWLVSVDIARSSNDILLRSFAERLPNNFSIVDLRSRQVGSGFSWGASGPDTGIRRAGAELLFAVERKPRRFLNRIFSRRP
jgi:cell wall assembly regulator SMI1